ncbi:MAG: bestrophin family ion channel [Methylococcales bacterium]|nr:bestrophin family ion channel [Methylococcales bacterium]
MPLFGNPTKHTNKDIKHRLIDIIEYKIMKLTKFTNQEEPRNFLRGALMWQGSVTPRILLSVFMMGLYTLVLSMIDINYYKLPRFEITPFEYTGAVLGLVLVFRTNAGHERWWEARKLWGAIVNQSRNLLIMTWNYGSDDKHWREEMTKWVVVFSFATKESLRLKKDFNNLQDTLNQSEIEELKNAQHMPIFVAGKIAGLLQQARSEYNLDMLLFTQFEKQRILLIDHIGACERILKTPMPLVYAIKTRRFILLYLLLLPFSLIDLSSSMSALIAMLVAYPLLSIDKIGLELQNPFAQKNLSHLPLETICQGIKNTGMDILATAQSASTSKLN